MNTTSTNSATPIGKDVDPIEVRARMSFWKSVSRRGLWYMICTVLYLAALWFLWEAVILIFNVPRFILPPPSEVLVSYRELPWFYAKHAWVTFQEAGYGLLIGLGAGLLFGIVLRFGGPIGRVMNPFLLASQVFPKEALAPIFIVALGFGMAPKILISALICFFPIAINTFKGLQAAPSSYERLMHVLGASPWQTFWRCYLPFSLPYIFAALRVSATLSVIGAVVGEFVGASSGLGHVIRAANADIGTERIYAALILLGIIGAIFYGSAVATDRFLFGRFTRALDVS